MSINPVRYRVHLPAHGTIRDVITLREALTIARPSARDGWGGTRIVRLADGEVLYQCESTEHGTCLRRVGRDARQCEGPTDIGDEVGEDYTLLHSTVDALGREVVQLDTPEGRVWLRVEQDGSTSRRSDAFDDQCLIVWGAGHTRLPALGRADCDYSYATPAATEWIEQYQNGEVDTPVGSPGRDDYWVVALDLYGYDLSELDQDPAVAGYEVVETGC